MSLKNDLQKWLISIINDPFVKILVKNSNFTKTQLETFLIDILAEKMTERKILYEEKAKLRLLKKGVTRGAFNRTLKQARKNVIEAIYTIILLGYLGVLESPSLEPYLELANKLEAYKETYRNIWKKNELKNEYVRVLNLLQKEIENGLKQLSEPKNMTKKS
ncbi:MAG: hypothetical protein ACE5J3_07470 [Methanosarcinales archaeon]